MSIRWYVLSALLLAALLVLVGCLSKDSNRPVGARCSGDGECRTGLHCVYGRCRQPCTTDRDCGTGAACVPSDEDPTIYVCTLLDESGGSTCPEGLTNDGTGVCRRPCEPTGPEPDARCGPSQSCNQGWCRRAEDVDGGVPGGGDGGLDSGADGGPSDDGGSPEWSGDGPVTAHGGTWLLIDVSGTPFTMGSPVTELGRQTDEVEHQVTLTGNYWLMETEITQQQFLDVMGYNPSSFSGCGTDCPVERVNWHEVAAYANSLSGLEGLGGCYSCTGTAPDFDCSPSGGYATPYDCPGYRLPTEAEWEYAARGGTTTATYAGDLDDTNATFNASSCNPNTELEGIAWWCGAVGVGSTTHAVAGKNPNAYGLYDMLGNVNEWCHDWYGAYSGDEDDPTGAASGSKRVLRGGSWGYNARDARAAFRGYYAPGNRFGDLGGRVSRSWSSAL